VRTPLLRRSLLISPLVPRDVKLLSGSGFTSPPLSATICGGAMQHVTRVMTIIAIKRWTARLVIQVESSSTFLVVGSAHDLTMLRRAVRSSMHRDGLIPVSGELTDDGSMRFGIY